MSDVAILARQVRFEQKSFWRNPASAVFTFAFPLLFLVIFATLNTDQRVTSRDGISFVTFYVPGITAFGLIAACYQNLAIRLSIARDLGVLKRVRGTPIPAWVYIGAQLVSSVVTAALLVALTVALGVVVYGVQFRTDTVPGLVAALVLGALCFCSLGAAVTALVPNSDAAPAVVNFSLYPLLFVSGIFFPIDNAPRWLHSLAGLFPVQHLADALQYAFDPRTAAPGVNVSDLLMLAFWTMVGLIVALRFFRWESRRS